VSQVGSGSRLLAVLQRVAEALDARAQPWALVGGLAVSVRAEPRFTRDIDVAVAVPDDDAAEALVAELTAQGFSLRLSLEQQALGRLATVRLLPPGEHTDGIIVDLLFSSSGIERDICQAAERLSVVPGLEVPVARTGHLVAMKLLARAPDRLQDAADLIALLRDISPEERERAVAAVTRIADLGAHRGKPLRAELEALLGP
jgi:predicted nucleotidyltransferase